MKSLKEFLFEGNISNLERKYREFAQMCAGYNTDINDIKVCKTTKNNWCVYNKEGKKIFLVSSNILNQAIIDTYKIAVC